MDLSSYFAYLASFITVGSFVIIDLMAATTNALNGALLAQRPNYYKGRQWTILGIVLMAIFGGIGGGVSRDILLNKVPSALTNPWYLILCILAGFVGMLISYKGGQKFRETFYQFMTSFSLPWYAIIGVSAALSAGLPDIGAIAIGVVGPTAGRFLIDITAGNSAKQFIRGEWFVGVAILTSVVYLILFKYLGLTVWPATLIAFAVGFIVRVAALWFDWEEPLPKMPAAVMGEVKKRPSLKEKMKPGWEPDYD
jgi:uncharacterized membrane protein YeiH